MLEFAHHASVPSNQKVEVQRPVNSLDSLKKLLESILICFQDPREYILPFGSTQNDFWGAEVETNQPMTPTEMSFFKTAWAAVLRYQQVCIIQPLDAFFYESSDNQTSNDSRDFHQIG